MTVQEITSCFDELHRTLHSVLELLPEEKLYWKPFSSPEYLRVFSCGELITHIAGEIEMTCNGMMTDLWDDPIEWTLREALPRRSDIKNYLDDVARCLQTALSALTDEDLFRTIYTPMAGEISIERLLLRALAHGLHHRGQLYAYAHLIIPDRLPPAFR